MIDPACLFLLGCWASLKVLGIANERPNLITVLTKDAERFQQGG